MDWQTDSKTNQVSLRQYQQEAVDVAYNHLMRGQKKIRLDLAVGTGATSIIMSLLDRLFETHKISNALILTYFKETADQIKHRIHETRVYQVEDSLDHRDSNIYIMTSNKILKNKEINREFDIVVFMEAEYTRSKKLQGLFIDSLLVGITKGIKRTGLFGSIIPVYSTHTEELFTDVSRLRQPLNESQYGQMAVDYVARLLAYEGYIVNREPRLRGDGYKLANPDMIATTNEQNIVINIKAYKSRYPAKDVLDNAILQLLETKKTIDNSSKVGQYLYCLILFSEVDTEKKTKIHKDNDVIIWDISNLLYIASNSHDFMKELTTLVYYSISDIAPMLPIKWKSTKVYVSSIDRSTTEIYVESLIEQLEDCKPGKEGDSASTYERICTEIIIHLFENVFHKPSPQHQTDDGLFRIDLLCGIKGGSEFWDLLRQHYNTRFVVFEYKNYTDVLSQNLVYITEKYLFNAALRNVAIIISRKGFADNANAAALGCLKESGKLILGLVDNDLKEMLYMKLRGNDPSDHLLSILNKLLMSIGK